MENNDLERGMTIDNSIKFIKYTIEMAQKKKNNDLRVTTLMGKPGIGKTSKIMELAKDMNLSFYHVSAPEISIEQMSGLPEFVDLPSLYNRYSVAKTESKKGTAWSCPEIILNANMQLEEEYKDGKKVDGCILLLDDLHEMPLSTMSYLYQFLSSKKVSGWMLDKKIYVVSAMNDSKSANFNGLPSPIINRMRLLKTTFSAKTYLEGYGVKFGPYTRSFLKSNSHFLNEIESKESAYGTPRSWTILDEDISDLIKKDKTFLLDNLQSISSSLISEKAADEFLKHVKTMEHLNLKGIVEEKKIFDISKKDALEQILYGYIINFIDTIEDGLYLKELLEFNIKNHSFVGFASSEIFLKYKNNNNQNTILTPGMSLFLSKGIDVLEETPNFGKLTKEQQKIIDEYSISEDKEDEFFEVVAPYII